MKRLYEVTVERGDNFQASSFLVAAASDEKAVRRAKLKARAYSGIKTGWRCVFLRERRSELIA